MDQLGRYMRDTVYPEADTPPLPIAYRTHESERERQRLRERVRDPNQDTEYGQATRGRPTRPGQPGAPVTRRTAARDTELRIPRA